MSISETTLDTTPATRSGSPVNLVETLSTYLEHFTRMANRYDGTVIGAAELEQLVGDYTRLVTTESHEESFARLTQTPPPGFADLVDALRTQSARCAATVEKYRARQLIEGRQAAVGYFDNVEDCIDQELRSCLPNNESTVVVVGSGSFPMSPLHIARSTGARVFGVDVDPEAIGLGRQVVAALGPELPITLEHASVEDLPQIREATHVVFSSTVAVKYDLLDAIHPLTREDIVIAMRFGNGLKSLFNYPRRDIDPARWRTLETIHRPQQIFDIALYAKPGTDQRSAA